ncbi:MAG TPA: S53 family peptidase [Candidatus Binataceae bacterium]|nr:S53 family peptidase [Candidatus Binataceae bacterium]
MPTPNLRHRRRDRHSLATLLAVLLGSISIALASARAEQQMAPIAGNHSPAIDTMIAPQPAPGDKVIAMGIDLNPTNRVELERLLTAQQDPTSPDYHRWLKRGEFDRRFGPDPLMREAITQWLVQKGFKIASPTSDHRVIRFQGTITQAQDAFGVAIYSSDGGKDYGNLADPSIPSQFADAIGFIDGLDNLRAGYTPLHTVPGSPAAQGQANASAAANKSTVNPNRALVLADSGPGPQPITLNGQTGFGPSDFYTFYDETPLLNQNINGSGSGCIGVIEISDYSPAALTNFDTAFGLPAAAVTDVVASDSDNPGLTASRAGETMMDIEYSHAIAPQAPINDYLADPATFGGNAIEATVDALNTAVNDNACSALSISIESCGFPAAYYTGALHTTYAQAATQGQTILIAEGDQGAAEYDVDPNTHTCVVGTSQNVNELASDPLVTSIGGTQFTPIYKGGKDVGFVSESVWNEGNINNSGIGSGGGGASVVFTKPAFQNTGTPNDSARDVPDISMEAACHTPGVFSTFPTQSSGTKVTCCACGTSLGAPIWAGITELLVQSNSDTRVGTLNPQLYKLGNLQDTASTGIRDVTTGNNDFNGVTGFNAVTGFDLASGWGTPDIATFVPAFLGNPRPSPTSTPSATATPSATPSMTPTPTPTPTPVPAELKLSKAINFGKSTKVNTTSKPKDATVKNASSKKGGATATIGIATTTNPVFAVTSQCAPAVLAPGKSCKIFVTFAPTDTTPASGNLMINDDAIGSPQSIPLSGTGKAPKVKK